MDPKKMAVMILAKPKRGDDDEHDEGGDEPSMPPLEDVMSDFLAAVEAKDTAAMAKAFRAAKACADDYQDSDEDDADAA